MAVSLGIHASGETRDSILVAALRAFSEKGFVATSTREIAKRAGVNHGLIRYYFGAKEKLWREAVDRAFAELRADLEAVMNDTDLANDRERLGRLIRGHVHFVARNPEFVRLMHEEGKRRGPRMRWMVDRHVKPLYEGIQGLIGRAQQAGLVRADLSAVHFFYIFAGAVGVIYHQAEECRRLSGVDPFAAEAVKEHARLLEQMLLGPATYVSGGVRK